MLKLKKVVVTGNIACGKSSVCQIFKELGAYIISADEVVHRNLSQNQNLIQTIVDLLGPDILDGDKCDRKAIAEKVFDDPAKLNALENLIHPIVEDELNHVFQKLEQEESHELVIVEIPVLFENERFLPYFDAVVLVSAPKEMCRARYSGTDEDFDRKSAHQVPIEQKEVKADFIIRNDKDFDSLKKQVATLYQTLTS